ncbi:single-stranded DNA-binding protein [Lactobacillus mulieris]|uniref:Single-stranded DNA-binding protein n=1 Tax=Lactobacillus mulieris TaxID=2508708 RepID=A0AAW5WZA3_9LACO|nr:single-stranded DNA-binding protein [Lactobacillus mulieris]KAA9369482.1 single-stranded DNA-binding protein [Lactobacillus jensenii]MCZ9678696.1 single-stranded DNA-binding protein [Lactobacillus mulieris]
MINRVILVGRLTKDINLTQTKSNISVGLFTLAVNRQYSKDKEHRDADFISCIAWRKAAEILAQYTHKGSRIGIDGRIQTRNYEDKNGQRVYVTEVVVDNFELLDSKSEQATTSTPVAQAQTTTQAQPAQQAPDPFADGGDTIDISDDDLPF